MLSAYVSSRILILFFIISRVCWKSVFVKQIKSGGPQWAGLVARMLDENSAETVNVTD